MKFQVSCLVFFFQLLFLLQLGSSDDNAPQDFALSLQGNVERLIEKIITQIQEFYSQIKTESKCIPDNISDSLMETLKKSVDCVHKNEKSFVSGKIREQVHLKNFLHCFSNAKKKVKDILESIDPSANYCPGNMTEKTYHINVTTTYTKTFHIYIKNGLDVFQKKIEFFNGCGGNQAISSLADKFENSTESTLTDTYENSTKFFETEKTYNATENESSTLRNDYIYKE